MSCLSTGARLCDITEQSKLASSDADLVLDVEAEENRC